MNRSVVLKPLFAALAATLIQSSAVADSSGSALSGGGGYSYARVSPGTPDRADGAARVQQALLGYAAGCASRDERALTKALTLFAVIEYPTAEPGRFVSVSAFDATRCWAAAPGLPEGPGGASALRVYPTSEPDVFFVEYTRAVEVPGAVHSMQALALIQMNGGRIALIRDYADPAFSGWHR